MQLVSAGAVAEDHSHTYAFLLRGEIKQRGYTIALVHGHGECCWFDCHRTQCIGEDENIRTGSGSGWFQPEGLSDSSRWSQRSADHRATIENNSTPGKGVRKKVAPLRGTEH